LALRCCEGGELFDAIIEQVAKWGLFTGVYPRTLKRDQPEKTWQQACFILRFIGIYIRLGYDWERNMVWVNDVATSRRNIMMFSLGNHPKKTEHFRIGDEIS